MPEEDKQTIIKISLKEGSFEVSGSEAFVKVQMPHLEKLILESYGGIQEKPIRKEAFKETKVEVKDVFKGEDEFENIFEFDNDKATLITESIPGRTTKEKMINVALIYLLGIFTVRKDTDVPKKEILKICEQYGCKDSGNFASHIKSAKGFLVVKGNDIHITKPGIKKAKELVTAINEEESK